MRLLTLAAALFAAPLWAADGHLTLNNPDAWSLDRRARCGLACDGGDVREARGIGFGQNLRGGVNSNDANVMRSRVFEPGHGISRLTITLRDAQDEGTTRLTVRDFSGNKVFSRLYDYVGDAANGEKQKVTLRASDYGRNGWRGLSVTVRTTDRGAPTRNGNGISLRTNYRADPSCQPSAQGNRGKASKGGKGRRK